MSLTACNCFPLLLLFHRFAIMCGIMTDYDTVQNKIKNGYIFKVINTKGFGFVGFGGCRSNCLIASRQASDHRSQCGTARSFLSAVSGRKPHNR